MIWNDFAGSVFSDDLLDFNNEGIPNMTIEVIDRIGEDEAITITTDENGTFEYGPGC